MLKCGCGAIFELRYRHRPGGNEVRYYEYPYRYRYPYCKLIMYANVRTSTGTAVLSAFFFSGRLPGNQSLGKKPFPTLSTRDE